MLKIGFANQYYTLWNVTSEPKYFTDSYGKHHIQCMITHYNYIKNISTDLDKVKTLHPDLVVDNELRGKTCSWVSSSEEDLTPEILKFGKYSGKSIQEIVVTDFNYILWLIDNCYKAVTRDACKALPQVIDYYAEIERKNNEAMQQHIIIESGEVELEFTSNPNYACADLTFIQEQIRKTAIIPSTLQWEQVNEASNKDWTTIEKAESEHSIYGKGFFIKKYKDSETFWFEDANFATIEHARRAAEIRILVDNHQLNEQLQTSSYGSYLGKNYANAKVGETTYVTVIFDEVKYVTGMYPYYMGFINGKAMKLKGKKIKVSVTVLNTEVYPNCANQIVVVK